MSRIGREPITIPAGVTVTIADGNVVTVKGKLGELTETFHPELGISVDGNVLTVTRSDDDKETRALHGLTRALIANMVKGVTEGFQKKLEIVGVGYKVETGTTESQVDSSTMPSKKLPSTVISTWSAMELRLGTSMYLGSLSTMPSQMPVVITSRGRPPASRMPAFTRSASCLRCTWPGLYSFQELTTAMRGLPCSSAE